MRVRHLIRQTVSTMLPKKYLYDFYRRSVQLNPAPSDRLIFRLAQSKEDLEGAFRLLHDCYVRAGFMQPHPSGLRVTKYHALPSTSTIVALCNGQVVGTMSLVRRSQFGLPVEQIFNIQPLIASGGRIVEGSALAVHPSFSGKRGEILFPLLKYVYEYSLKYFGVDQYVCAVNPAWIDFYRAILLFEPLDQKEVANYSFVNGAKAVGGVLDIKRFRESSRLHYGHRPPEGNIHAYFHELEFKNFQFPARLFKKISDPVLTPELLDYFFNQRTQVFSELDPSELCILHDLYKDPEFAKVLPPRPALFKHRQPRKDIRYEVDLKGHILVNQDISIPIEVKDISAQGVVIHSKRKLRDEQKYQIIVEIGDGQITQLTGQVRWNAGETGKYGMNLIQAPKSWMEFIAHFQTDLIKRAV